MKSNDVIILDETLEQKRLELAPDLTPSDYFEIFTAEQILKDFDLSYDEIASGIVGGGNDGGIDGLYLLVNGDLIQEDTDVSELKKTLLSTWYLFRRRPELVLQSRHWISSSPSRPTFSTSASRLKNW